MDAPLAPIQTAADVMSRWPTDADFARDIGIKPTHAQVMKFRRSIPSSYWARIVSAAAERGIDGVTLDVLAAVAAARQEARATCG